MGPRACESRELRDVQERENLRSVPYFSIAYLTQTIIELQVTIETHIRSRKFLQTCKGVRFKPGNKRKFLMDVR